MDSAASEADLSREVRAYMLSQREWAIEILSKLIAYPSTSGNEAAVTAYLEQQIAALRGELLKVPVPTVYHL